MFKSEGDQVVAKAEKSICGNLLATSCFGHVPSVRKYFEIFRAKKAKEMQFCFGLDSICAHSILMPSVSIYKINGHENKILKKNL